LSPFTHLTLLATIAQLWNKTKTVIEVFKPRDPRRFETALRRSDEENSRDQMPSKWLVPHSEAQSLQRSHRLLSGDPWKEVAAGHLYQPL